MSLSFIHRRPDAAAAGRVARQHGFTLFEVLIAIVVMSFGLLGLAALQMTSMKNNNSAHFRAQATLLAYDIVDRMRANRDVALAGSYDTALSASAPATITTVCDQDLSDWKTALAARLPSGQGSVTTASSTVTVIVSWDDSRGTADASGSSTQQWTTVVQL